MLEIAARAENATADEQADILWEAWAAIYPLDAVVSDHAERRFVDMLELGTFESAAMTLVPEGHYATLYIMPGGEARAGCYKANAVGATIPAATAALALTAACLRAHACDSGSGSQSEDPSGAEAEGPQSGGEAASPKS